MRIWVLSDLHLIPGEISRDRILPETPEADVCVIAGDLKAGDIVGGLEWLSRNIRPHMETIFVAGNHEFYRTSIDQTLALGRQAAGRYDINFLDDSAVTIGSVRFFGSTLWSDFNIFAGGDGVERGRAMAYASERMNDFRLIRTSQSSQDRWSPITSVRQHMASRIALETDLKSFNQPMVVITHHAPHPKSIATEFARDLLTPSFVSDLSAVIEEYRPALWIHGHTHSVFDYMLGSTRVVCNPLGYRFENTGFEPGKILDV